VYRPTEAHKNGGRVSQYLDSVQIGDYVTMSGPFGKAIYSGNGTFILK